MQTFKATGRGPQDVVNVCNCAVCQLFFFENAQANLSNALLSVLSFSTNTLWHRLSTSQQADRHTQTERLIHTVMTHPHFLVLVILLLSSRAVLLLSSRAVLLLSSCAVLLLSSCAVLLLSLHAVLLTSELLPIRINFNFNTACDS